MSIPPPSPPSGPPPGWYADPAGTGGARWWDGVHWSDQVRSPDVALPRLPAGVQLAAPRDRFWAAAIDGGIGLLSAVPAMALLFGAVAADAPLVALLAFPTMLVGVVLAWVHVVLYVGRLGQTYGKHVRGIEVRQLPTGTLAIGAGRAFGREFIKGLGVQVLLLGVLWILWDDLRRGWHDHAVDTVVVVSTRPRRSLRRFVRAPFASDPLGHLDGLTRSSRSVDPEMAAVWPLAVFAERTVPRAPVVWWSVLNREPTIPGITTSPGEKGTAP